MGFHGSWNVKEEIPEREIHGEGVPILLINFIQALECLFVFFFNYELSGETPRSLTVAKITEQILEFEFEFSQVNSLVK